MNKKGPGWILCPSKKYPGFFYYFNVCSGETAWSSHCLPPTSPQDGTTSNLERNLVQSRKTTTKTVQFGIAEFPKYINKLDHTQNKDVTPTNLWNRQEPPQFNDISSHSTKTESFKNVRVFEHKNKSTQRNFTGHRSWWNIQADVKPLNPPERTSKPFQLKPPKIKRFTKYYEPITSPIMKNFGYSFRNAQIYKKQETQSRSSKQTLHESVEVLHADDLRWKIMMKKIQKSAAAETSRVQRKDEQKSVVAPKRKVQFFYDVTDEESLKLNGDIGNDDAETAPKRLVILNQNFDSRPKVRKVQSEHFEQNLFLQNTSTFDPLALSKSLRKNDPLSLRTNCSHSITLNEVCDGIKRLNLDEEVCIRHHTYNVEVKLSAICTKYEDLQVHIMSSRIEEWICCYLQIMEQLLHDIFQVTNATKFEPPRWFFQGLKRFKEVFSHYKPVCAISDLLLSICGYCVKNGIARTNIKPNQFIKLLCGGIMLIEEFMKYTPDVNILGYKDMLKQLISSIRNPNIFHDINAIDVAYLGEVRHNMQQPQDYFHIERHGERSHTSQTFGISQKQQIKNKHVANINDSDCILVVSDDGLSNDIYDAGFNFANHKDSLINANISQVNNNWQNTDNLYRNDIDEENNTFCINAQEDRNNHVIDDLRLTRAENELTADCKDENVEFNGGIDTMVVSGRTDNRNHGKLNSYGVQENDRFINDTGANRVSVNGDISREETVVVERDTIDESNVIDVIQTMVKTTKTALEALKVHCENCYNELRNGHLTDGRKKYLRENTNQALIKVTAMLLELKGITKRDESMNSPIQHILGDQGESYKTCINNCITQTLLVESALKFVLQVIDEK